ncbi:MAG TPA: hypothetical protein VF898_00765 [Chloroflexota bacterium]
MEEHIRLQLGGNGWVTRRISHGASGRPLFLGESDGRRAVLKTETRSLGLRRLAEIGAAPQLPGGGVYQGEPYVLQENISGEPIPTSIISCAVRHGS